MSVMQRSLGVDGTGPIPVSTVTDQQERILSLLPIIPSILSVFGSLTIIHMVLTSKRRSTPYKRLLLGMSICDTILSLTFPLYAFLVPHQSSHRIWAVGNDASCNVMGFFSQFTFAGILYNGMLSYYYLLTVRYGYKDPQMSKCAEPVMHIVSIAYPVITGLIGVIFGFYSELELGIQCWVNDYPRNCGSLDGQSGEPCLSPTIGWIFGGAVVFFVIISIVVNNVIIYRFVRQTIYRGRRKSTFRAGQDKDDSQTRRVQAVATQGFLYVGCFLLSYSWPILIRILEGAVAADASWESTLYPVLVCSGIFMPLQGFCNLLVYARPNYMRTRREHPNETRWWCFRRALHGTAIEPKSCSRMPTRPNGSINNTAFFITTTTKGILRSSNKWLGSAASGMHHSEHGHDPNNNPDPSLHSKGGDSKQARSGHSAFSSKWAKSVVSDVEEEGSEAEWGGNSQEIPYRTTNAAGSSGGGAEKSVVEDDLDTESTATTGSDENAVAAGPGAAELVPDDENSTWHSRTGTRLEMDGTFTSFQRPTTASELEDDHHDDDDHDDDAVDPVEEPPRTYSTYKMPLKD
jgi:hypothetical protein